MEKRKFFAEDAAAAALPEFAYKHKNDKNSTNLA